MPRLPVLNPRKVLMALLRAGFYVHHQTGSHAHLRHYQKRWLRLVIPNHSRDLAPKTLKSIIIQSEFTIEEFLSLL